MAGGAWNSCLEQMEEASWGPVLRAVDRPRLRRVEMESSARPPKVSNTRGMNRKTGPAKTGLAGPLPMALLIYSQGNHYDNISHPFMFMSKERNLQLLLSPPFVFLVDGK